MAAPLLAETMQEVLQRLLSHLLHANIWAVIGAIVPALLLVWYFYSRDKNPEPRGVIVTTFVLGVLISIPILLVGLPIKALLFEHMPFVPNTFKSDQPFIIAGAEAFIAAALPEEVFKFLVVWLYCSRHKAFDEPMDGIVYGATASLGFAALENVLYASASAEWLVVLGRAITAVPFHAFLGVIMGYYVGRAKFDGSGFRGMLFGLLCSYLLHGLYDFCLMVPMFATPEWLVANGGLGLVMLVLGIFVLIGAAVWAFVLVGRARREQRSTSSEA